MECSMSRAEVNRVGKPLKKIKLYKPEPKTQWCARHGRKFESGQAPHSGRFWAVERETFTLISRNGCQQICRLAYSARTWHAVSASWAGSAVHRTTTAVAKPAMARFRSVSCPKLRCSSIVRPQDSRNAATCLLAGGVLSIPNPRNCSPVALSTALA